MMSRFIIRLACSLALLLGATTAMAKDSYIPVNGVNYFVRDSGGSGQTVLMLHGEPDDCTVWSEQVKALTEAGYRVICPDLLGYGKTDKPEALDRYVTSSVAADVGKILDDLDIHKPVDVVGHDWGSVVASELYFAAPDRVKSLTLLAVGHPEVFAHETLRFENSRINWFMMLQSDPRAAKLYRENNGAFMRDTWLQSHPRRDAVVARLLQPGGVEAMLRWDQSNPVIDVYIAAAADQADTMPNYRVPVLGIAATGDQFLWPSQMSNTRDRVDGRFQYVEIKGGSHWMMIDHAAEVSAQILAFLASLQR